MISHVGLAGLRESVNLNHVNESLRRIIRREESIGHGRVCESLRECHLKVNQCNANIERLTNRLQTQTWYHELSDQEGDDEIDRMVGD